MQIAGKVNYKTSWKKQSMIILRGMHRMCNGPLQPLGSRTLFLYSRLLTYGLRIILILFLLSCLHTATTLAAMKNTLTPRISIYEQYDDNIDLQEDNEVSDWITGVSPGISLIWDGLHTKMNLDYETLFAFYQDNPSGDTTRHRGKAVWDQELSEHWRFHLSDRFLRSEDTILETEGEIEDIRRERRVYYRNDGTASLAYEFGAEDQVTAGYSNALYVEDESARDRDSIGHAGFLNFDMWFGPRYGIGLTSQYHRGEFEQEDDFDQYSAGLTLNYRWHPSRRLYTRYDFLYHDFDQPETDPIENDFRLHRGALGTILGLGPNTDLELEGGYFVQDYFDRDQLEGGEFSARLTSRTERTLLRLKASGGYDQDYYTSENLGSSEYYRVIGYATHHLTENLSVLGSASYRWEKFFGVDTEEDREDEVWRLRARLSLSFWRWFTVSLEGTHTRRDSDDPTVEFVDNRGTLGLTAAYPYVF